jgi:hypothetical protein
MPKIITIENDPFAENPADFDGAWKLYSFSHKHRSYKDRETFFPDGKPTLALRNKLRVGLAFVLDYYEHGLCCWSLSGNGPSCRWDTARGAGLLVWEHKPSDMGAKSVEDRAKDAAGFLETYTAWANGEVYAYSVEEVVTLACGHTEIRDVPDGSCCGFYGNDLDYMKSEIIACLDGDTEITLKGEAAGMFDADDFKPKAAPPSPPSGDGGEVSHGC